MKINHVSPTTIKQARLCEARLMGRLNQLGEAQWEEEHGEGALMGTLAHNAAKIWYRPNEKWLERVVQGGESWEKLYQQAVVMLNEVNGMFPATDGEDDTHKAARLEAMQKKRDEVEAVIAEQGLLKHPFTNIAHVFRLAITELSQDKRYEVPKEIASLSEARDLFEAIINHYKRETLNVVFAERRYKGTIGNGVPIHLILDLGVDRGDGRLELIDYKTGWITMSTEEMYDEDQVLMNLLAVARYDPTLARFPNKSFTYFWVRSTFETGPVSLTDTRLIDYEHYLATTYQHLLDLKNPSESTNRFCVGCPRRLNCGAFQELMGEATGKFEPLTQAQMEALTDEEVMTSYDRTHAQMKLLEDRKKTLAEYLRTKLERLGLKVLETETFKATTRQSKHDSYDPATVLALCMARKIDPATVVDVTKKSVDETFGADPEAMRMLGMTMRRGCTSPFMDIRQVSKKKTPPKKKAAGKTE